MFEGDEFVVSGGVRVIEDFGKLGQMGWPQQMVNVAHRLFGEEPQRFALDMEEFVLPVSFDPHAPRA